MSCWLVMLFVFVASAVLILHVASFLCHGNYFLSGCFTVENADVYISFRMIMGSGLAADFVTCLSSLQPLSLSMFLRNISTTLLQNARFLRLISCQVFSQMKVLIMFCPS